MKKLKLLAIMLVMFTFVATVYAADMSKEFSAILTNGKLVLNSFKPSNADEAMMVLEMYIMENHPNFSVDSKSYNEDYTSCKIMYINPSNGAVQEEHVVSIEYNYDKNIKKIVDSYVEKLPTNKAFEVKDMELVNFWINSKGDPQNLINYSSDFKKNVDYKNFRLDIRMGDVSEFYTMAGGIADFKYEGTVYAIKDEIETEAKHKLYVPTTVGDTKEELIEAIQSRIDKELGKGKVKITAYEKTIPAYYNDLYDSKIAEAQAKLDAELAKTPDEQDQMLILNYKNELSSAQAFKAYFEKAYNETDGDLYFLHEAEGNYYFNAQVGNKNYMFIIVKSNEVANDKAEYKTSDMKTDIMVETKAVTLPLDTQVIVSKLTDGVEYDRIIKILNVETSDMFNIKLYSESTDSFVTQLANGTFKVRIPLDSKFQGKDVVVYYTDASGKVTEHEVTVENGYAVFTTDHFSIYTLAVKSQRDITPATGINNNIGLVLVVAFISLMGVTVLNSSRKEN